MPRQEQNVILLLEKLKEEIQNGKGFYIEMRQSDLKPLLKNNKHLKPENYDELLNQGWKNAAAYSLQEAKQKARKKDKFWVKSHLTDARKYAKRGKIDISQEVASIKKIYSSPSI